MRTPIAVFLAAAALAGCTVRHTTVQEPAAAPAPVVVAPAPTVVYQAPPTVVHEPTGQEPIRTVSVTYNGGLNGFELAVQRANAWCGDHYGNSAARLVADDRTVGRATFACIAL